MTASATSTFNNVQLGTGNLTINAGVTVELLSNLSVGALDILGAGTLDADGKAITGSAIGVGGTVLIKDATIDQAVTAASTPFFENVVLLSASNLNNATLRGSFTSSHTAIAGAAKVTLDGAQVVNTTFSGAVTVTSRAAVVESATSTFNNVQLAANLTINAGVTVELIEDSVLTIDKGEKLVIAVDSPANFKSASGTASIVVTDRTDAALEVNYRQTTGTDKVVVANDKTATLPVTGVFNNSEEGVTVTE